MKLFVDTSALVALADKSDQNHQTARNFFRNAVTEKRYARFVATTFILDEVITRIATTLGTSLAFGFAHQLLDSGEFQIEAVDQGLIREALHLLQKYGDKLLSFTDLTSFAYMKKMKLTHVMI